MRNKATVLVVSKDVRFMGGVANFIRIFIERWREVFENKYHISLFVQGKYYDKWKNHFLFVLYPYQYLKFAKILKNQNIDIVHLNPSMGRVPMWRDGLYLRIAKKHNVKVLFFIHGWNNDYFEKAVKNGLYKSFHKKTLERADAIVVLSPEFKDKLVKIGIKKNKIYVLTTMVEVDKYISKKKDFSPPYKLLFCSRLVKEKGVYEAIEAMKYIVKKYPDAELWIIGKGKEYKNIKEYVKRIGVEKNVKLLGYLSEMEKYEVYKKAHIFIFPTYYGEGFPTVIIEAMAAGLPIITTPVGGLKYSLKEGINCYFINSMPPRPKEIAKKILYLLENKDILYGISNNNIKDTLEKYEASVVLKRIIQIYKYLLKIK